MTKKVLGTLLLCLLLTACGTAHRVVVESYPSGLRPWQRPYSVDGERYMPLQNADGFREEGLASWYGREEHGNRTSNGEVFDMNRPSAAHKTLPLGCYVRVINKENGRQAVVRVNDRGPFVPDRILDLSYRAALDLAIVERGVAPVAIEVVSASSGTPARVGAPDSPAAMPVDERRSKNSTLQARRGGNPDESMPVRRRHESPQSQNVSSGRLSKPCFAIQVGAFSDSERARIVSERLKADFPAADVRLTASGSQHLYRVRAGRFQSRAEAETACTHLMKNGYPGAIIVAE